jgi:hypothetical protein
MQFSLKAMFIATALVAVACFAAKLVVVSYSPMDRQIGALAIPVLIGAAVGTLTGRVASWVLCGVAVDLALIVLVVISLAAWGA